jgi:hypothetical protein
MTYEETELLSRRLEKIDKKYKSSTEEKCIPNRQRLTWIEKETKRRWRKYTNISGEMGDTLN